MDPKFRDWKTIVTEFSMGMKRCDIYKKWNINKRDLDIALMIALQNEAREKGIFES